MKMFPIMTEARDITAVRADFGTSIVVALPWPMLLAHEAQAIRNHQQTVAELAARCGLSACEACAVLEDRPWRKMPDAEAHARLKQLFTDYVTATKAA